MRYHQAGELGQAEKIYRQVLRAAPSQPDALHLLGVLAHQNGRNKTAVDYITRAIAAQGGDRAGFHVNLGNAYKNLGKPAAAAAAYRKSCQLKPGTAARCLLATVLPVLSVGAHDDPDARWIRDHADRYVVVPNDLAGACRAVAEEPLDVLFYRDVGMDPVTTTLARNRLAPVQCVTWGRWPGWPSRAARSPFGAARAKPPR